MKEKSSTIDEREVERFSRIASEWWDERGKFKPLHAINPVRIRYILERIQGSEVGDQGSAPASLAGLSLLDIGCGGGLVCEPMRRLGAEVTGIDASEKNIGVASLHAGQSGLTIDYRATTAEALCEQGKQYDIVLALEIIEHVADVALFVDTCCRLVKPGGIMVWSTINRTPKSFALAIVGAEYVLRWLPRGTHDWRKFLKPSELCGYLRKQHMDLTDISGMVFEPFTRKWRMDARNVSVNYYITVKKPVN